jgi:alkylated DNA repair protein (DNA oxidative demethylase)
MTLDLFAQEDEPQGMEPLGAQAFVLRGFARAQSPTLISAIDAIVQAAPFRHMVTPGGFAMSVALTTCGSRGWVSDQHGYRYSTTDPMNGQAWPAMPDALRDLAQQAATVAGFSDFEPDACLINRYVPGSKMSLHQDKDERDLRQPIVSVSLGIPATFLFGGLQRKDPTVRVRLTHGDVVVWGGVDRLRFHGIVPLKDNTHPLLGAQRFNLTFRKAG